MRTRLLILGMALLIILTACGGNRTKLSGKTKDGNQVAQANATPKPGEQSNQQSQQQPVQNPTPNQTSQKTSNKSKASQSPTPAQTFKNTLPLERELTPTCGSHGTLMTLKIQTRKTASLSIAVAYSDNRMHGNYYVGNADDQGRFTYTWVIPTEAPMGKAQVLLGAGDHTPGPDEYSAYSTGESYTEFIPFRVATSC